MNHRKASLENKQQRSKAMDNKKGPDNR